ncbi:MAG TPA: S8 family serine peptidase [Pyrinomonadaceae bacterium]
MKRSKSVIAKIDPLLTQLLPRTDKTIREIVTDWRARDLSAGFTPDSLMGEAVEVQCLMADMSDTAEQRLFEDNRINVLVSADDAEALAKEIDEWNDAEARPLSHSTLKVSVAPNNVTRLAVLENVRYIEASVKLELHCDLAHVSSNLYQSATRTVPQTGNGVLVGIVDSGIDTDHPAFIVNGATRILYYHDQITKQTYLADDINKGTVTPHDDRGHGTHVAGIAAGNGDIGTPYAGVAPAADLAVVKTTLESADVAAAIQDIFRFADERGQPCVVNLSLGAHRGAHDGSNVMERTIDDLSGSGRIVVTSAGNAGTSRIHASTVLTVGKSNRWVADFELTLQLINEQTFGDLEVLIWNQHEDKIDVSLRSPNGDLFTAPQQNDQEFTKTVFKVVASHRIAAYSGDHQTSFRIITLAKPELLTGWSVIVQGVDVQVGAVHAWIVDTKMGAFTSGNTQSHLVGMPGTAYSAITVASYATRRNWLSADPQNLKVAYNTITLEDISYFSSPGPTRDGDTKPEIAAPGQYLIAPLSSHAPLSAVPTRMRMKNCQYAASQGTSMAAPYVTGAIALLLEKAPAIDWAEAKRRLIKSCRQDSFTSFGWNPKWGYGKINIRRLLEVEPK